MNGKVVAIVLILSGAIAGGFLYYLQVYGYYHQVQATVDEDVKLVALVSNEPEPILYENFQAIDAESSPIRYRACFDTQMSIPMLTETYELVDNVIPRNAPSWFDCFDSAEIAAKLEAGTALAFMGEKNVHYGVDRIVAITDDGQGYVWHELNDCGEKSYDGTVIGEECPPRPDAGFE